MDIKENQQTNSEQNQQVEEEVESVNKQTEKMPKKTENEKSGESDGYQEDKQFDHSGDELNPELESEEVTDRLESAENEDNEEDGKPEVDYTNFTKEQLVERLRELIQNENIPDIKKEVEIIKANFYKKHRAQTEEEKKKFINEGGNPEEFTPSKDQAETELKELLKQYKEKKANINKQIENQKQENLRKKYEVIDELKNLINKKESLGQTFKEFRELQRRW